MDSVLLATDGVIRNTHPWMDKIVSPGIISVHFRILGEEFRWRFFFFFSFFKRERVESRSRFHVKEEWDFFKQLNLIANFTYVALTTSLRWWTKKTKKIPLHSLAAATTCLFTFPTLLMFYFFRPILPSPVTFPRARSIQPTSFDRAFFYS